MPRNFCPDELAETPEDTATALNAPGADHPRQPAADALAQDSSLQRGIWGRWARREGFEPRSRSAFNGPILSALVLLAGVAGHSPRLRPVRVTGGRRAKCRPDLPGRHRRAVASPTAWMLRAWLHDLGRSGEAAFKFAWVLGEVAGDVTE
jgi:hypothetical protein